MDKGLVLQSWKMFLCQKIKVQMIKLSRGNFANGRLEILKKISVEKEGVVVTMWLTQSSLTRNKNLGFTPGKADQFQSFPLYSILS